MKHIIIGSKPYYNIILNNMIDNNFTKFYRINLSIPGNNNGTLVNALLNHAHNKLSNIIFHFTKIKLMMRQLRK